MCNNVSISADFGGEIASERRAQKMQRMSEQSARDKKSFLKVLPNACQEIVNRENRYTDAFKALWSRIETQESVLILWLADDDLEMSLDDVLDEGKYEFISNDTELLNALQEIWDYAKPLYFDSKDVTYMQVL